MKQLLYLLFFPLAWLPGGRVLAQYIPVDQGSNVTFKIRNFGINSEGSFTGLEGKIGWEPGDVSKASFDVSVKAASVNTDNNMRDGHLRGESYFDVEKYPKISFVSTSVKAQKDGFVATGKLTMKGTAKEISIPFTAVEKDGGWFFSGEFTINRKDFGVGGSSTISSSLTVMLKVLAKKS